MKYIHNDLLICDELQQLADDISDIALGGFTDGSVLFADSEAVAENNNNLWWDNSNLSLNIGDHSVEASTISINGSTVTVPFKVNHFGGTTSSQFILHRHSTTNYPIYSFAYSNSDTTSHGVVAANSTLAEIFSSGWTGSTYNIFSSITFASDSLGSISNGSAPGKMYFNTSPNSGNNPLNRMSIDSAGDFDFITGNASIGGAWSFESGSDLIFTDGTPGNTIATLDENSGDLELTLQAAGNDFNIITPNDANIFNIVDTGSVATIGIGSAATIDQKVLVSASDRAGIFTTITQNGTDSISAMQGTMTVDAPGTGLITRALFFSFNYNSDGTGSSTQQWLNDLTFSFNTTNNDSATFQGLWNARNNLASNQDGDTTVLLGYGIRMSSQTNAGATGSVEYTALYRWIEINDLSAGFKDSGGGDMSGTQTAIWISEQTRGATNYGIVLDGDITAGATADLGAAIIFGADQDVAIYGTGSAMELDLTLTANQDLNVRSSGDTNLLYADGQNGRIGISTATPAVLFDVLGESRFGDSATNYVTIESDGDVNFVAGAGLQFGEIYGEDRNVTVTISAGTGDSEANKVQITGSSGAHTIFNVDGESNGGVTPANAEGHITVTNAGRYLITCSITCESVSGAASEFSFQGYYNNGATKMTNIHAHRDFAGGGGDTGSISLSGIVDLPASATVEIWLWNDTNTQNIIIDDITLSIVQIGGTT